MIYSTAEDWLAAPEKRVLLFGMSGVGKTHASHMLRASRAWYHYSIDYRIGTRYMGEHIVDNVKREAMKVPFLRDLLMSDSIYIGSNITFDNLAPLSTYLGKPGDPAKGGLRIAEYQRRQAQHEQAEISALLDTAYFVDRAKHVYGYPHFLCDTGGSICEVVDPHDPNDPVLTALSSTVLMVWVEGSDTHTEQLIRRFDKDPKPMSYQPAFLATCWADFIEETGACEDKVDPDAFIRWTFARALAHRTPRYAAMADLWGVRVKADALGEARTVARFEALVAEALGSSKERRLSRA